MVTNKNVAAKLTAATTGNNGTTALTTPPVNGQTKSEDKKEDFKILPEIVTERKTPPSIEDRFFKMDVLFSHREKYQKIKDSLDKVTKFKLSTDGRNDNIILKDANSTTFSTFNPEVFTRIVDWLKEDLSAKLKEVERQIIF